MKLQWQVTTLKRVGTAKEFHTAGSIEMARCGRGIDDDRSLLPLKFINRTNSTAGDIRSGEFKDAKGRRISVANEKIPAFCCVISDITPTLERVLKTIDATPTPQNLFWLLRGD